MILFRQTEDEFIKALTCIRVEAQNEMNDAFMQKVCRKVDHPNNAAPVNLYATRYTATDIQPKSSSKSSGLLENCPTPRELHLKKGSHVMLVRNNTPSLVNRTTRVVVSFASPSKNQDTARALSVVKPPVPIVRFSIDNGRLHTILVQAET
ncbi:hypothetical protein CH63R_14544 [Colletotrichum higginsianum IMI 349063]|uniref:DNA helicase Pif1-like 2B domain-containing protein n=1 Tax=Colletotrichum higginsianum (strain IMI 349063) TaxID=759273 RepID=A0A1B7XQC9_COLHI|nr:hypothetical protein CH63R_14544 [Colletotrichum higginsianum IMI 349063]OBR01972.1 hypothetical protein CH63R_14544 [Colletotrichum higginsianum IMI 349063]